MTSDPPACLFADEQPEARLRRHARLAAAVASCSPDTAAADGPTKFLVPEACGGGWDQIPGARGAYGGRGRGGGGVWGPCLGLGFG